ncbi:MAG: hypothetical protein J0M17_24305 [Planctomycetes bacterium]|nr:hypothetical protein [Planctomycetota bacterium]
MISSSKFGELLEAVEQLSAEDQAEFIDVVRRRLAAVGRKQVAADVAEGRREFGEGHARVVSADDIIREIES